MGKPVGAEDGKKSEILFKIKVTLIIWQIISTVLIALKSDFNRFWYQ
jgi:hypothetical protein